LATSGSVDFSVTRDDIIQDALENLGIVLPGATPVAAHVTAAARKLNMIVKQWQGTADFAPGLKMWSRKRATMFLSKTGFSYTLGPTTTETGRTNKFSNSYAQTTLSVAAAVNDSAVTVTATTGIASGYRIGVVVNSGALLWTTVSGALTGNSVPLTTNISGAADIGSVVFCYATTTQGRRPLSILTATLKDSDGVETALSPMTLEEYSYISDKDVAGTPTRYLYESSLTDGSIYLDCAPSDTSSVVYITYLSPPEDFDASTDNPDFPQEWYRPLSWQLTMELAPSYGRTVTQEMKLARDEALMIARNTNPETSDLSFEPNA
jgi:hypothetical protein